MQIVLYERRFQADLVLCLTPRSTIFATGRLFSPNTQVFSTNKTDRYDKTEILLNGALLM
jgi:hypothetical protein